MILSAATLVCDATVVLNLGHRGELEGLAAALRNRVRLILTTEVAREVSLDEPSYYARFLGQYFVVEPQPLHRVSEVEQAAAPLRLDSGEISVLSLCLQTGWPACIDEMAARKVAKALRIELCGTFGLLQHGILQGWMTDEQCIEAVRRLRRKGLYCPSVRPADTFATYFERLA